MHMVVVVVLVVHVCKGRLEGRLRELLRERRWRALLKTAVMMTIKQAPDSSSSKVAVILGNGLETVPQTFAKQDDGLLCCVVVVDGVWLARAQEFRLDLPQQSGTCSSTANGSAHVLVSLELELRCSSNLVCRSVSRRLTHHRSWNSSPPAYLAPASRSHQDGSAFVTDP
jgi:hypothetical protein